MTFPTEALRLKKIGQLQSKLNRQMQAYKDTEAELAYWTRPNLITDEATKTGKKT